MKDAKSLQVEIVQDGEPRIIPEDVEIALDKIGYPIGTFEFDEVEDFASTAIMVVCSAESDSFDFSQASAMRLEEQIKADTGGTVSVDIRDF